MALMERDTRTSADASHEKPLLTLDDLWRVKSVSDVQPSPDGSVVAYVVGSYDEQRNESHSAVWLVDLRQPDGAAGSPRRFTSGDTADMQPRWSADGRHLAFVSTRHDGKPQIFVMDRDGGEPRRLTSEEHGATSPAWSPDGARLCFSMAVPSDRQRVPQEMAWLEAHPDVTVGGAQLRRQNSLLSRFDGRGYIDKRAHLFLVDIDHDSEETASVRQLTDGDFDDADAVWSPDGRSIAFVSNRGDDQEHSLATDIWIVEVESGDLRRLTDGTLMGGGLSWSPDGRSLAFYACPTWTAAGYRDTHLWLVSTDGSGEARDISGSLDLGHRNVQPDYAFPDPSSPAWSLDSSTVYFTLIDHGDDAVHAVDVRSGEVTRLSAPGTDVYEMHCPGDGTRLILLAVRPDHPFDLFVMPASGGVPEPLVSTHRAVIDSVHLVAPRHVTCTGAKGLTVEGWLYTPRDLAVGALPPLVVHIHGGPYGAWGNSFYFQAQALAGLGYASLYVNPRGSLGYGQEFSAAADWGEDDFGDVMACVDAVLQDNLVDPTRLAITGISYGGFMTNWALGHSDRFRAGVSVNGVSNQVSMFGVSDMSALWLPHEFGGTFWENDETWERYRHHSPLASVDRITSPLLLIQSENDYRCPIEQGEQMLTALRARHQTVELIRFPGCSHVIGASGTPLQRYLQWRLAFDWFDAHLKPTESRHATSEDEGGVTATEAPSPV
jgi:dipeptidyl aminopeptidase/acylaminoacyl peptidase